MINKRHSYLDDDSIFLCIQTIHQFIHCSTSRIFLKLRELLCRILLCCVFGWLVTLLPNIKLVHHMDRQTQELMLVPPSDLSLDPILLDCICWRWWWICDLGNQERSARFCDAVNQYTNKRNTQECSKGECEAKKDAFTVFEPLAFLGGGEWETLKIGYQLFQLLASK
jgi:hypothetical protein